jgi:hypothetical protein
MRPSPIIYIHTYPHVTGISGKSNSQRFQNWLYISIVPIFTSRLRNYQKLRTSPTDKSSCVIEYAKTNSCIRVQLAFRKRFLTNPPPRASIQRCFDKFENQGCMCKKKSSGRPRVSDEAVQQVEATFSRSPRKSVRKGSREIKKTKLRGFSPQANYTDRATAACRRS